MRLTARAVTEEPPTNSALGTARDQLARGIRRLFRHLAGDENLFVAGVHQPNSDCMHTYGDFWQPGDEEQAMQLVLNETDPDVFEASGRRQAEDVLCPRILRTDVVMDLGCGIGRVARYVARCCGTLWAVDASERMLTLARERLESFQNISFARSEGTRIPSIESGSVDFAYSILTLQHLEREDAFLLLRDVHRILRPGGSAFFTFPNLLSDVYLNAFLAYAEGGEVGNPVRARFYTPEEVRCVLPAAGFDLMNLTAGVEIEVDCARGGTSRRSASAPET